MHVTALWVLGAHANFVVHAHLMLKKYTTDLCFTDNIHAHNHTITPSHQLTHAQLHAYHVANSGNSQVVVLL